MAEPRGPGPLGAGATVTVLLLLRMDRRASVSIPCNSPRNPDWIFFTRTLGREVGPEATWDDERAAGELRKLLFEARATRANELFAATLDLRTDETANSRDLPGLHRRFIDVLFFQKKDALGRMQPQTRYNPAERYFSDIGKECIDRAVTDERYALAAREKETALRISGVPAPEIAPLKDTDCLPFGRFRDRPVREVPAGYLDYLRSEAWVEKYPEVVAYLAVSAKAIDKELGALPDRERLPDKERELEAYEGQAPDPGI